MPKLLPPDHTGTELYRRHAADCKKPNRCGCPLWIYGYIRGKRVRESLKTCRMDVALDRQKRREGRGEPVNQSLIEQARRLLEAAGGDEKDSLPDCSIEDGVEKFLAWSKINSVCESSLQHYRYNLRHFTTFCASHKIRSVRALTKPLGNDLVLSLAKYAPNSRVVHFSLLRSLFGYLRDADLMGPDPLPRRGPRKPRLGTHRPLDQAEQGRILATCQTPEERALILLLLATGLRGVDVRRMRFAWLDLKTRVLRMTPHKTRETSGQEVIIPDLPVELITALHALPRRIDSDLLFPEWIDPSAPPAANDTSRRRFNRALHSIFVRSEVKATGHDLRCTFAVERLYEGASIYDVSLLLGHANVATTQRYYARWENKDAFARRMAGVMEKARFDHLAAG